jgi:hypothetical protein
MDDAQLDLLSGLFHFTHRGRIQSFFLTSPIPDTHRGYAKCITKYNMESPPLHTSKSTL